MLLEFGKNDYLLETRVMFGLITLDNFLMHHYMIRYIHNNSFLTRSAVRSCISQIIVS